MSEQHGQTGQMRAVTVSREYGSGGGEISARLAARLGWRLVDHELVVRVARELNVSEAEARAQDEYAESLFTQVLIGMRTLAPPVPVALPVSLRSDTERYQEALRRVVAAAVAAGQVVIVGRGGQAILSGRREVLHVRVVAPLGLRVAYVMRREGLSQAAAQERIQLKDRDRLRYLQAAHNLRPDDAHLYDLVVNTAVLDLESAVELVLLALQKKAVRLAVPKEALGPAAGLAAYPGQPADLRPPDTPAPASLAAPDSPSAGASDESTPH
jgi:cytidylate kinase